MKEENEEQVATAEREAEEEGERGKYEEVENGPEHK
jgi:hypothetical protein